MSYRHALDLTPKEGLGEDVAKKSRGWKAMTIAGQKTVREREYDQEECEGCGSRTKPVYTYLGRDGEPTVCSKRCFESAMVTRFGGVRQPTRDQARLIRQDELAKLASMPDTGDAQVLPLRRRGPRIAG